MSNPSKSLHIVHLTPFYTPFVGGAQTYVRAVSRRLVRDGHRVTVVTSDATSIATIWSPTAPRASPADEVLDGIRVLRCRIRHGPGYPFTFHTLRRAMTGSASVLPRSVLQQFGLRVPHLPGALQTMRSLTEPIDVLHAVNITVEATSLLAQAEAKRRGVPLIATPFMHVGTHDIMRNYTMPHQLDVLRDSQTVFAQTWLEHVAMESQGVPRSALMTLGMGVEPDAAIGANPQRFRTKHNIALDQPIVLFMGTQTRDKGAVHTAQAVQQVWQKGVRATIALAGDTPDAGDVQQILNALSPDKRANVLQLGIIGGADKQDALAAATLLALPSRVDSFGIVLLEAWLHGKPVIGADAGGLPDVISDEQDGFIVPFGDVEDLAARMLALIQQPQLAQTMGERGRAKTLARYTWDAVYARWMDGLQNAHTPQR